VKGLKVFGLFPNPHELEGFSRNGFERKGCTAPGVAVEFGEDNPGKADSFIKGLGNIHRGLAGHGVRHKEEFIGLGGFFKARKLRHHRLVDLEPSGGVDYQGVDKVLFGPVHSAPENLYGIRCAFFFIHGNPDLVPQH